MEDKPTKQATREIIEDWAKEIKQRSREGATPSREVIYFRNEHRKNMERTVMEVPVELLRFRKDNGRIASDVLSYEKNIAPLLEASEEAQKVIRKFLEDKDPEKTNELINSIKHSGQRDAAIITADGFLINGNRRKMALSKLWEETNDEPYQWMKVVILPGLDDEGGPPTKREIEQIENRYQLQSEGKAEYYKFDRALSMRRKIELGMTLEEQLRDDPNFTKLAPKEFQKIVKKNQDEYLEPLNCIDRYLDQLGRSRLYSTISSGMSDREGRWQAFLDYSNHVRKKLDDEHKRMKMDVAEDEIGDIEEIAFRIIRKREFKDLPKVHKIMRDLPKLLENKGAKKELFKLLEIDLELPEKDCIDEDGREYDERKKDHIWNKKHEKALERQVKRAKQIVDLKKVKESPLTLMEAALNKLTHENMDFTSIDILGDYDEMRKKLVEIQNVASSLESELYKLRKKVNKLEEKYRKKNR